MMIRQFEHKDYSMIKGWWDSAKEIPPTLDTIPETSYIMYLKDQPILSVSLYLTNAKIAWIDNYVGNPLSKGPERKECGMILLKHLEDVAKKHSKDRLFCMSMNEKTSKRYIEMGFTQTGSNINTFILGVN
jgi:hypothetical protein